jgi:diguanylate cyclase (GGDEF)-like protein
MMLDIDHFKDFNDTYGHDGGDALLRELGELLLKGVRGGDVVARYGGEEFVIMLPSADLGETKRRAEELRKEVEKMQVYFLGHMMRRCTISIGLAAFPLDGVTTEELIRKADAALYRAKRGGRTVWLPLAKRTDDQ